MLETNEGVLHESMAIAKYLANGHQTLLGTNDLERAQIDQWTNWVLELSGKLDKVCFAILGTEPIEQTEFNDSMKEIKEAIRAVSATFTSGWLVGNSITVADIMVASILALPFQLVLDEGFRKPSQKVYEWFDRVAKDAAFASVFGRVKICAKALKPVLKEAGAAGKGKGQKQEQKKQEPKKEEAPPKEEKKINPLDALPPSPWNFFDFKTLMVNHKDKAGGGMEALKEQFDPAGYSFWFFHYDKYKGEGEVLYKTENLMKGFLQRFDHFRKHCLARVCILNEEPKLEIEGVWCFRGNEIPFEMHDHPQFEYYETRKINFNDKKDFQLIREFWSAEIGKKANGMKIQSVMWHK
jgi:elongation factor 1-gamma